jgi:hypothetical protein
MVWKQALFRGDVWCARQKPFTSAQSALMRALTIVRLGFAIKGWKEMLSCSCGLKAQ